MNHLVIDMFDFSALFTFMLTMQERFKNTHLFLEAQRSITIHKEKEKKRSGRGREKKRLKRKKRNCREERKRMRERERV